VEYAEGWTGKAQQKNFIHSKQKLPVYVMTSEVIIITLLIITLRIWE